MEPNQTETMSIQKTKQKFSAGQTTVGCQLKMIPAVILHPSLGAPLVVEPGKPVSLFIVTDQTFKEEFMNGNGQDDHKLAKGGSNIADLIMQHLKILPWDQANTLKKNLEQADEVSLKKIVAKEQISVTYLGELDDRLENADGQHFANLRQSLKIDFIGYNEDGERHGFWHRFFFNDGIRHIFQIDLDQPALSAGKMYDCFWLLTNLGPKAGDSQEKYLDIQDRLTREYIQSRYYKYCEESAPLNAFKVTENGVDFTAFDPYTPIQTRHPVYVMPAGKRKLNLGHLSDIHVSAKQHLYKGKKATVIPSTDSNVSPLIGTLANNNVDNLFNLLQQFGKGDKEVDAIVITGDLYDHMHNFDPGSLADKTTTGQLWEALYVDSIKAVKGNNANIPCGIDGLAVYSIICHFYKTYGKPIFIVTGNHEAYEYPYGISPRLGSFRPNDGIPLDHNLTFYEAILMYGPAYKILVPGVVSSAASELTNTYVGQANFNAKNFDWFYHVFTPLTDYTIRFADQCLVGLGWGDGEKLVNVTALPISNGGTLPRATESVNRDQISMKEAFISANTLDNKAESRILMSHFTQANYALECPLAERGEINGNDFFETYSSYDHGSVRDGRATLYGEWIGENHFDYTLSGHSHRVGLYRCDNYESNILGRKTLKITAGYPNKETSLKSGNWTGRTKLLVSASAGPIPKQNHAGEMSCQGMETPSGSRIMLDGHETIQVITSTKESAKPRFCVACDYIDIMGGGFWEYFRAVGSDGTFEMKPCWDKIHPDLSDTVKQTLIKEVAVYFVGGETPKPCLAVSTLNKNDALNFDLGKHLARRFKEDFKIGVIFLTIKFNGEALTSLSERAFQHYDFTSPWNIQVGIYSGATDVLLDPAAGIPENQRNSPEMLSLIAKRQAVLDKVKGDMGRWEIKRHKQYGEIPDHKGRAKNYPEYAYNLNPES